eukprot:GFUD01007508.1.p1 GENE.GFUD01007508.1~~GFUD01007508.1.p1  ORF type:complete len:285 (+),score=65.81 GFUD01007508.1:74-928(+)
MDEESLDLQVKKNQQLVVRDNGGRKDHKASVSKSLSNHMLLRGLTESERNEVFEAMFNIIAKPGDLIIKQGDEGDNFYIIEQGEVDLCIDGKKGVSIGEGGTFGELALIYSTARAATLRAVGEVKLWGIGRMSYRQVLMSSTVNKRKSYQDLLSKILILERFNKWEKQAVADALEATTYTDGELIVKQGQVGDEFFFIIEGSAVVSQIKAEGEKSKDVCVLKPADYFGEVSLMLDMPRAASVTAKGPVTCAKLDKARFRRVLSPCLDVLRRNIQQYKSLVPLNT